MNRFSSLAPRRVWTVTLIGLVLVVLGVGACVAGFIDLLVTVGVGGPLAGPVGWMFVAVALYAIGIPMMNAFVREQRRRRAANDLKP